jgi:hypothetical protein
VDANNSGQGGQNSWGAPPPDSYRAQGYPYGGYQSFVTPPGGGGGRGAAGLIVSLLGLVLAIAASFVIMAGVGMVASVRSAIVTFEETLTTMWIGLALEVFALILAIVGTVLGVSARKRMPPGRQALGTAAMVCGIIGLVVAAVLTVACGCVAGSVAYAFGNGDLDGILSQYGRYGS